VLPASAHRRVLGVVGASYTHVLPSRLGRYRTPLTLRGTSRGMRFGEMRVLSQGFIDVWAAEPQLPGTRRGHRGRCQCCSRPVEHAPFRRKALGDNVLRVVERGALRIAPRSASVWPGRFGAAASAPPGRPDRVGRIPDGSREWTFAVFVAEVALA